MTGTGNSEASTSPDLAVSAAGPERPNIGRFVVLEQLGAGGMGVVVAAYDPTLDRADTQRAQAMWTLGQRSEAVALMRQASATLARDKLLTTEASEARAWLEARSR